MNKLERKKYKNREKRKLKKAIKKGIVPPYYFIKFNTLKKNISDEKILSKKFKLPLLEEEVIDNFKTSYGQKYIIVDYYLPFSIGSHKILKIKEINEIYNKYYKLNPIVLKNLDKVSDILFNKDTFLAIKMSDKLKVHKGYLKDLSNKFIKEYIEENINKGKFNFLKNMIQWQCIDFNAAINKLDLNNEKNKKYINDDILYNLIKEYLVKNTLDDPIVLDNIIECLDNENVIRFLQFYLKIIQVNLNKRKYCIQLKKSDL